MEGFRNVFFLSLFFLFFNCKTTDKNTFKNIDSISLNNIYDNEISLDEDKIDAFKKDLNQLKEVDSVIFPICYSFKIKQNKDFFFIITDGNFLMYNSKYYYSKDNLITKYFNILEENFCRDTKEKLISIIQIKRIFDDYTQFEESTDSEYNKSIMLEAIQNIKTIDEYEDLEVLINVWMYYDPTDFNGKELILEVFKKNKEKSLKAIQNRIENKKDWEFNTIAPYSDLFELMKQVQNFN